MNMCRFGIHRWREVLRYVGPFWGWATNGRTCKKCGKHQAMEAGGPPPGDYD